MKKVSVVLCTYNGSEYLREQLESIVNQIYPIYELIIQDDKSTDNTIDILNEYALKYAFIKVYVNNENKGFRKNFLTAYLRTSGDYICSSDQDDIWNLNKVKILVNSMENSVLVFSNSVIFGSDCGYQYVKTPFYSQYTSVFKPFILGHQMMFDRSILSDVSYYIEHDYPYDYFIFLKAVSLGSVKYVDKPLVKWRRHNSAVTFVEQKVFGTGFKGYYDALLSLSDKDRRKRVSSYFAGIKQIKFEDQYLNKAVSLMSNGNLFCICCSSFICLCNFRKIHPQGNILIRLFRSFWTPVFFIHNYGKGIVSI